MGPSRRAPPVHFRSGNGGQSLRRHGLSPRIQSALILALALAFLIVAPHVHAQSAGIAQAGSAPISPRGTMPGTLFASQPTLFPDDGRIKLLVLPLNPTGLTESATEQIGLILQKNLSNTGHFAVVGPREVNAGFEKDHPTLVDCREIACGVESGKVLGADRILVGTIRSEDTGFFLRVRLIDPANNLTDYEEQTRFDDTSMDDVLFKLANSISRNTLRVGRVLSTSVRGLVISLGRRQGLKIGDMLVIYKQDVPITNLEGEQVDTQRKNIALVRVLNVNDTTVEANLFHQVEEPQVGQFAATYLDEGRQIELVENTRRELDTGIRLANKVKPLELAPVLLADSEKKRWQLRLQDAEASQNFWGYTGLIAGGVLVYTIVNPDSSTFGQALMYGAIGASAFSAYKWFQARNEVNQIRIEGRAKGFVLDYVIPIWTPNGPTVAMGFSF